MTIRQVVTMKASAGKGDQLLRDATRRSNEILAEEGCLQWEVFQSSADPDKLIVMELWADMETFRAHYDGTVSRAPGPEIMQLRDTSPMQREDYEYGFVEVHWPHPATDSA